MWEPVANSGAPEIRCRVAEMMETMEDAAGAGLAAPQVHVPLRLFRVPEARGDEAADDTPILAVEDAEMDAKALEIAVRLVEGAQSAIRPSVGPNTL